MKSIAIFYFSGTGNTWWVAETLRCYIKEMKHPVEFYSIETIEAVEASKYVESADHIVFGFPVYGSTAPNNMLEFISNLPDSISNKPVSIFATHALASGDTGLFVGSILASKGYKLMQTRHFAMMNNLHVPRFKFIRPRNDYSELDKIIHRNKPEVRKLAYEISHDILHITGDNIFGHFFGKFQRRHIDRVYASLKREFKIDGKKCVKCGKCAEICPTHNITSEKDSFIFKNNCVSCLRCYSFCPASAVLIGDDSMDTVKYPRFKGPIKQFDIHKLTKSSR